MTICRFYSNGFCRYGSDCRYQHIRPEVRPEVNNYNQSHRYSNRYDVRPTESTNSANRIGFSFNKTFQNINSNSNQSFGQQIHFKDNSNFRSNDSQMSSFTRNVFQSPNQRVSGFSFNRTLQEISTTDRPSPRVNDIDMDSVAVPHIRTNTGPTRDSMANSFGLFSQSNNSFHFGNQSSVSLKGEAVANSTTIGANSDHTIKTNEEIYTKDSDLSQNDLKAFESNIFTFKSIPVCPPPQRLCF